MIMHVYIPSMTDETGNLGTITYYKDKWDFIDRYLKPQKLPDGWEWISSSKYRFVAPYWYGVAEYNDSVTRVLLKLDDRLNMGCDVHSPLYEDKRSFGIDNKSHLYDGLYPIMHNIYYEYVVNAGVLCVLFAQAPNMRLFNFTLHHVTSIIVLNSIIDALIKEGSSEMLVAALHRKHELGYSDAIEELIL